MFSRRPWQSLAAPQGAAAPSLGTAVIRSTTTYNLELKYHLVNEACNSAVTWKKVHLHFFQNLCFFIFCIVFTFSIMSEKISLLGSVVSEIEMSYLHFESKFTRK